MKLSRFTISIPDFPGKGKYLLFNTRTRAQVVIDDVLMRAVDALPEAPRSPEVASALPRLHKMGFLVTEEADDGKAIEDLFAGMRDDDTILHPTVLTTYACNFACVYCIEDGVKAPVFMDEKTAADSVSYIMDKFRECGSRQIFLAFYGGEPLLNMPAIRTVAKGMHGLATAGKIPFSFGISTNGALLTREAVEELKPLGFSTVKITLDGPKETHDRKRPFRNGEGSFDVLVANVRAAVDLTNVDIEVNLDGENVGRIPELLDFLAGLGIAKKIRRMLFSPISATPKDRERLVPTAEIVCAWSSPETSRWIVELRKIALEKGFNVDTGSGAHKCELVMKRSSFLIDPCGDLYGCSGFAGWTEYRSGSIYGGEKNRFLGLELWRRCAHCAYVPLCGDGCPLGAYIHYGDPLRLSCNKESMEYLVRENLKLNYLRSRKT